MTGAASRELQPWRCGGGACGQPEADSELIGLVRAPAGRGSAGSSEGASGSLAVGAPSAVQREDLPRRRAEETTGDLLPTGFCRYSGPTHHRLGSASQACTMLCKGELPARTAALGRAPASLSALLVPSEPDRV